MSSSIPEMPDDGSQLLVHDRKDGKLGGCDPTKVSGPLPGNPPNRFGLPSSLTWQFQVKNLARLSYLSSILLKFFTVYLIHESSVANRTFPHSTTGSLPNSFQSPVTTATVSGMPARIGRAASCTQGMASSTNTSRTPRLSV